METDYLTFNQAELFINKCDKEQTFIYGIERFIYEDGSNRPDLGGIADFSSLEIKQVTESISASKRFMSQYGNVEKERFKIVFG